MSRTLIARALLLVGALGTSGCAGARVKVTADRARYPLSLSPVVRDGRARLRMVTLGEAQGDVVEVRSGEITFLDNGGGQRVASAGNRLEVTLGMVAARYHPDVLLPLDGRGRPVPEYGKGNICEKCADLGQLLATSTPATGRP